MQIRSDRKKFVAGIMAVMMLVVLLASFTFFMHEAGHECTGEDCEVCIQLEHCSHLVKKIGTGMLTAGVCMLVILTVCGGLQEIRILLIRNTPFLNRVRLND